MHRSGKFPCGGLRSQRKPPIDCTRAHYDNGDDCGENPHFLLWFRLHDQRRHALQSGGCQPSLHQGQILDEFFAAGVTLSRFLRDCLADQSFQAVWNPRIEDANRGRVLLANAICGGYKATRQERMLPCEHFVEHNPEREHVGAAVGRVLQQHFGRHVGWSSREGACAIDG